MKKYRIELVGTGYEMVFGKVSKKQYEYWSKNDIEDLNIENNNAQRHQKNMVFIDDYDWSSFDDLGHFEGVEFGDDGEVNVYDTLTSKKIWCSKLGEWNLSDQNQKLIESDEWYLDVNTDAAYAFQGVRTLNGCFMNGEFDSPTFDSCKVGFSVMDVMGRYLVQSVSYDGTGIVSLTNDLYPGDLELSVVEV